MSDSSRILAPICIILGITIIGLIIRNDILYDRVAYNIDRPKYDEALKTCRDNIDKRLNEKIICNDKSRKNDNDYITYCYFNRLENCTDFAEETATVKTIK